MELRPWETMTPVLWGPGFLLEDRAWEGNSLEDSSEWVSQRRPARLIPPSAALDAAAGVASP